MRENFIKDINLKYGGGLLLPPSSVNYPSFAKIRLFLSFFLTGVVKNCALRGQKTQYIVGQKFFKKNREKCLTNSIKCSLIGRHSSRGA